MGWIQNKRNKKLIRIAGEEVRKTIQDVKSPTENSNKTKCPMNKDIEVLWAYSQVFKRNVCSYSGAIACNICIKIGKYPK